MNDIYFASSQSDCNILVAENENTIVGTIWGYKLPLLKFPFLTNIIDSNANYIDEIAVDGKSRRKGIGKLLGREYMAKCKAPEIVLRTDERNIASMSLFSSLGFVNTEVRDPEFNWRVYLRRRFQ